MPRRSNNYVGDCSIRGVAKKAYEVTKNLMHKNQPKQEMLWEIFLLDVYQSLKTGIEASI